jgi:hypothetical protein
MANLPGDFALKDGTRSLEHMDAHSLMASNGSFSHLVSTQTAALTESQIGL